MPPRSKFLQLSAAAGLCLVGCLGTLAIAASSVVQILDAPIVLPDPPELTALRNKDSPYSRSLLANSPRQLASYLPPADAKAADGGGLPMPRQWASAFTLPGAGGRLVTQDEFLKELLPAVEASIAKPDPLLPAEAQRHFGIYVRKPSYFAYGSASVVRVEREGTTADEPIVAITGFVLVKQRLFSFALFREYQEPRDIERTKADAVAWAEAITRANQ